MNDKLDTLGKVARPNGENGPGEREADVIILAVKCGHALR